MADRGSCRNLVIYLITRDRQVHCAFRRSNPVSQHSVLGIWRRGLPDEGLWLSGASLSEEDLARLSKPFPSSLMEAYQVSPAVNSVKNDDASLVEPVEALSLDS